MKNIQIRSAFNELVNAAAKDKRKLCVNLKEVDKIAAENGIA